MKVPTRQVFAGSIQYSMDTWASEYRKDARPANIDFNGGMVWRNHPDNNNLYRQNGFPSVIYPDGTCVWHNSQGQGLYIMYASGLRFRRDGVNWIPEK